MVAYEVLDQRKRGLARSPGQSDGCRLRRAGGGGRSTLDQNACSGRCRHAARAIERHAHDRAVERRVGVSTAGRGDAEVAAFPGRHQRERQRRGNAVLEKPGSRARPERCGRRHQSIPSFSLIRRLTSAPSARPLVSFMTAPTIAPGACDLAGPDLLDRRGVCCDRALDDRLELAPRRRSAPARGLDDRAGSPAGPASARRAPPSPPTAESSRLSTITTSSASARGRELRLARVARGPARAAARPRSPVVHWRAPPRRGRCRVAASALLEEAAELSPLHERRGRLGRQAVLGLVALEPRRRQLGQRRRARARASRSVGASGTRSGSGK